MKKALYLAVSIAIMLLTALTACEEDSGVGPVCPWEEDTKPDYRVIIDHYLGTIWVETHNAGSQDGRITLFFAAKEDRYCRVAPDLNQPYGDNSYVYLTLLMDGDTKKPIVREDQPFWTQYDDLLKFGGYVFYETRYRGSQRKGHIQFSFLLQDTVSKKIYRISDEIRYKVY